MAWSLVLFPLAAVAYPAELARSLLDVAGFDATQVSSIPVLNQATRAQAMNASDLHPVPRSAAVANPAAPVGTSETSRHNHEIWHVSEAVVSPFSRIAACSSTSCVLSCRQLRAPPLAVP